MTGAHSYFLIILWQRKHWLMEAGEEIDLYPVLSSTPWSFCTFLFFKEPVAIGTWKVDIIISIGTQTPLRHSPCRKRVSQRFLWSPRISIMLPTGTISLSSHYAHKACPLTWKQNLALRAWHQQINYVNISGINFHFSKNKPRGYG